MAHPAPDNSKRATFLRRSASTLGLWALVSAAFASRLAWAYVGLRVVHSLVQVLLGIIPLRFLTFLLSSVCLFVLAGKEALRVFVG